jgi:hypothetical protein
MLDMPASSEDNAHGTADRETPDETFLQHSVTSAPYATFVGWKESVLFPFFAPDEKSNAQHVSTVLHDNASYTKPKPHTANQVQTEAQGKH